MKRLPHLILALILGSSLAAAQSTSQPSPRAGGSTPAPGTVNPAPQSALVRILTPVAGDTAPSSAVLVRFQLTNPAAGAGEPNFVVQMDGQDPITTTSMEHTFTGLAPGAHSVTVTLVDANGTPQTGGQAIVQFKVKAPQTNGGGMAKADAPPIEAPVQISEAGAFSPDALPILSAIGFGVLLGGAISALKTRH